MNKFLKDLEKELKKLMINESEIKEILADHEEMLEEAIKEGLSEEELATKFGDPSKLAQDLCEDSRKVETNVDDYVQESNYQGIEGYTLHKSFPTSKLSEIHVKLVSEDLEMYPYDGEALEIHFRKVNDPEKYEISFNDGVFLLTRKKLKTMFSFNKSEGSIIIRYPKLEKLSKYVVELVSGDVVAKGIDTNELKLKSTSGDFELQGVLAGKTELTTVSGDFEMVDLSLESVFMSAVSGDFEGKDIKVSGEVKLNTVSGDFEFVNFTGKSASVNTVSGDLEAKEFYVETIDLKSVSGDIEIYNQDKSKSINVGRKKQ